MAVEENQSFSYPEDVLYSYQIRGVYDGVCVWYLKDGRVINRFRGEGSRREEAVDEWLKENPTTGSSDSATEAPSD